MIDRGLSPTRETPVARGHTESPISRVTANIMLVTLPPHAPERLSTVPIPGMRNSTREASELGVEAAEWDSSTPGRGTTTRNCVGLNPV